MLTFSFVGYKTQDVDLAGQTTLKVTLEEDAEALKEVIVTALHSKR